MPDEAINTAATVEPLAFLLVLVVLIFVGYLVRRDKQQNDMTAAFMKFLEAERAARDQNTEKITTAMSAVHGDLRELDTFLRTSIEAMGKAQRARNARTRKDDTQA